VDKLFVSVSEVGLLLLEVGLVCLKQYRSVLSITVREHQHFSRRHVHLGRNGSVIDWQHLLLFVIFSYLEGLEGIIPLDALGFDLVLEVLVLEVRINILVREELHLQNLVISLDRVQGDRFLEPLGHFINLFLIDSVSRVGVELELLPLAHAF